MDLLTSDWVGKCIKTAEDVPNLGCLWVVIQNIVEVLTAFAGIVALFLIVYSGIKYAMSGGNKEKVEAARKTLIFAIIGLIFIIFAYFILQVIGVLTGVGLKTITTPPGSLSP